MVQILFYHLTETSLEEALPALVEKARAKPWRVIIQTLTPEKRDALDEHLWVYRSESFLPHGRDGDEPATDHPIFLTTDSQNSNDAQIRFLLEGAPPPENLASYERIMVMFDGNDPDAVSDARERWKALKDDGHELAYWKQSEDGRWTKAA